MSEVKTNKISSLASNNDITLDPDGTGKTVIQGGDNNYFFAMKGGTYGLRYNSNTSSSQMMIEAVDDTLTASHEPLFIGGSTVSLGIAGSEKVKVDASGNVGINTSAGSGVKLQVKTATDRHLAVFDNSAGPTLGAVTDAVASTTLRLAGSPLRMTGAGGSGNEHMRLSTAGRLEFQTATAETGVLQTQRLDWRNENNAGIMAGIGVVRTAGSLAPGAFVIRTSTNVDSASNNSDGEISEKFRVAPNGDLTATDTSIASNSDQRLKENIADYAYDLAKFKQFQTRTFNWKQPTLHGGKSGVRGFVAQELEAIDSYWVNEIEVQSDSDDYQYLPDTDIPYGPNNIYKPDDAAETDTQRVARFAKTSKLGQKDAMYVSVIQQLIAKIETLETKVAALEAGE
jgi:hypothetical protein